jgi:polygalacturonase
VKIPNLRALVIAADPGEVGAPVSSGTGIYNVNAAPFQNAINDAASYSGGQGIVYVPTGVYKVGNLELKSDVALYLQGGSVLRFTGIKTLRIETLPGGFIQSQARIM